MDTIGAKSGRKFGESGRGRRRFPNGLWLPLAVAALLGSALSMAGKIAQGGQSKGRYWLEAGYQRLIEADERKRDAEYDEGCVLDVAGVRAGMTVGEVGAGNGYFTLKLAARIGPSGRIYANDIEEDFLAELRDRSRRKSFSNIETVLGTETDPRLPKGKLDMVFLVRSFHDLSEPVPIMERIAASLKPGGKAVVVEIEREAPDGKSNRPQTRRQYLDLIARTCFTVERIDKSLPDPKSIVLILAPK